MRNLLLLSTLTLIPGLSRADDWGLYAAAGQWYVKMEGEVGQGGISTSLDSLGINDETSNVFWLMFEHPVPFLPNVRLMHSEISTVANSEASQVISIGNIQIEVQTQIQTTLDLSHTDATFYYQLVDNAFSLDLGITARYLSGYIEVLPEIGGSFRGEMDAVVPTAYANLQIDFPYSGWHIGATANAAAYDGNKIVDVATSIGYEFDVTSAMAIGVNMGYRKMDLLVEDFYALTADATLSGGFVELQLHF
jgi:outer membrane protein